MRPARTVAHANDLTTVSDRNVDAVCQLLAGGYGTVMQGLARDAVARAWMGGYTADSGAVLADVTAHAAALGMTVTAS